MGDILRPKCSRSQVLNKCNHSREIRYRGSRRDLNRSCMISLCKSSSCADFDLTIDIQEIGR